MAFKKIKETFSDIKEIFVLSKKAQTQAKVLTNSLPAVEHEMQNLQRSIKRYQYQNQGQLDRIRETQEKMTEDLSGR